jgi:hypothetical protein
MAPETPGRTGLKVTITGKVSALAVEAGVTEIVYTPSPSEEIVAELPGPNACTPIGTAVPGVMVSLTV